MKLYGGMEGGGTKFVCAVGSYPGDIREELRFATSSPEATLTQAVAFFRRYDLAGIGLAPFGPLHLDPRSREYGRVAATPKAGWAGADILGAFRAAFPGLPLAFDLDVNAAAYGELTWVEANRSLSSLVYFTIGTGIGAGVIVNGQLVHGLTHPEAGHMRLPHDRERDPFPGGCPFHANCFEGLASGPSLQARWGVPGDELPEEHPAWELESTYIATALVNVILTLSPERIVLGGGVMERTFLFASIRARVKQLLAGYVGAPLFAGDLAEFIVPPGLGRRSGVLGAMALAEQAARRPTV